MDPAQIVFRSDVDKAHHSIYFQLFKSIFSHFPSDCFCWSVIGEDIWILVSLLQNQLEYSLHLLFHFTLSFLPPRLVSLVFLLCWNANGYVVKIPFIMRGSSASCSVVGDGSTPKRIFCYPHGCNRHLYFHVLDSIL